MSMIFNITEDRDKGTVRIDSIHGVVRNGALPDSYISTGDRVFSVPNQVGGETVVVITGEGKNSVIVEKLYKGKTIPIDNWNNAYAIIMRAGDRLHTMRKALSDPNEKKSITRKTICI
jgi:hypothetical protein